MTQKISNNSIPDNALISAQLKRIMNSGTFSRSKVNSNLLRYLVEYALVTREKEGKIKGPKEIEIAMEVFNKGDDYNPVEDSFVRVYISKLRKKLEVFYQTEGQQEAFQIIIPSGGYELSFVVQTPSVESDSNTLISTTEQQQDVRLDLVNGTPVRGHFWQRGFRFQTIITLLLVFSLSIHIYAFLGHSADPNDDFQAVKEHPIWRDLLNHQKPILIVVGDFFVIAELDSYSKNWRAVIDFQVNNELDLKRYFELYPAKKEVMHKTNITYLSNKSVFSMKHLLPLFDDVADIDIRLVSELSASDLREYNLVYLGEFKMLGPLATYFKGSNFQIAPRSLTHRHTKKVYDVKGVFEEYYTDYGLFAKFAGPNENLIYTFAGFSDASISQMTKFATTLEHLNSGEFDNNIEGKTYSNIELLFSTTSFNRTGLGFDIAEGGKINPDNIWGNTDSKL